MLYEGLATGMLRGLVIALALLLAIWGGAELLGRGVRALPSYGGFKEVVALQEGEWPRSPDAPAAAPGPGLGLPPRGS